MAEVLKESREAAESGKLSAKVLPIPRGWDSCSIPVHIPRSAKLWGMSLRHQVHDVHIRLLQLQSCQQSLDRRHTHWFLLGHRHIKSTVEAVGQINRGHCSQQSQVLIQRQRLHGSEESVPQTGPCLKASEQQASRTPFWRLMGRQS